MTLTDASFLGVVATRRLTRLGIVLAVSSLLAGSAYGEWPQFRGPDGQGHVPAMALPTTWSETENVLWKTDLSGKGWSSPVVGGGLVWITTAVPEAPPETTGQRSVPRGALTLRAVGVELDSGKTLHDVELLRIEKPIEVHSFNSQASPTPVLANGRLYCHFGTYGTVCLDTKTGKIVWSNTDLHIDHSVGPGSSPVLYEDVLILTFDGIDEQFLAGLDAATGELLWRTERSGKLTDQPEQRKSFTTPLIVTVDGEDVLISPAADWVYAYSLPEGKELWKTSYEGLGYSTVARPVTDGRRVYLSTGYTKSRLLAVDLRTHKIVWQVTKQVATKPSPLLVDQRLYMIGDKAGVAVCLDAETGEEIWVERIGGNYSASPIYGDGRIFVSDEGGNTTMIRPGSTTCEILGRATLPSGIMATPAAVEGTLVIRTEDALYRIGSEDQPTAANR